MNFYYFSIDITKSQQLYSKNFLSQSLKLSQKIKTQQKSNFITQKNDSKLSLKEGENIIEGIMIDKFLFNGEHSKFYSGYITQLDTYIMIKSFDYENTEENFFETLPETITKIQNISHENLLSYFDIELLQNKSIGIILMENFKDSISLEKYFKKYNSKNNKSIGLNIKDIKIIMKGILEGLSDLHENDIIHSELNLKNI